MIYEFRTYHVLPGKMAEFSQVFGELVMPAFKKHGFNVIGVWQTVIGENNDFSYILAFDDLNQRQEKFAALIADPAFKPYLQQPVRVSHVTNKIWSPLPYSPLK